MITKELIDILRRNSNRAMGIDASMALHPALVVALLDEITYLRTTMHMALDRYDREDTGVGFVRKEVGWAMADDLRTALKDRS